MNRPSNRALPNTISFSAYTPGQDVDAGTNSATVPGGQDIPCTIQARSVEVVVDDQMRSSLVTSWLVIFADDPGVDIRDKAVFTMTGRTHTAFVVGEIDYAGRGMAWGIVMEERT